ncbi:MAG: tRNA (adenosine(37)-N6)-threonylcarbamoyltransferase complex ATPase subunit type 1 TsaE [Rubellimicrobium sp.]|nr:tRNA (adenosine(37)-N6)-threonylcarbamoyltransferase complex ATPase subunit type 1 TsaE [Rubellimicrobium sp.]
MDCDPSPMHLLLPTEADTARLAARLAAGLRTGDVVLLAGPIGAGKSAFARALIRAATDDPDHEVPSPTFTLVQTYLTARGTIWHADLYRLGHPDEAAELGLTEAFDNAICLVEWPDRLGGLAPADALHLTFAAHPDGCHSVTLSTPATWARRIGAILA